MQSAKRLAYHAFIARERREVKAGKREASELFMTPARARKAVSDILAAHPALGHSGFHDIADGAEWERDRRDLATGRGCYEMAVAAAFLSALPCLEGVAETGPGAHRLSNIISSWSSTEIAAGAVVAAAFHVGLTVERFGQFARFNVGPKADWPGEELERRAKLRRFFHADVWPPPRPLKRPPPLD